MVKKLAKRAAREAKQCLKRFLSNHPANAYEETAFKAVRQMAFTFGKGVIA